MDTNGQINLAFLMGWSCQRTLDSVHSCDFKGQSGRSNMSFFGKIKDAVFGGKAAAAPVQPAPASPVAAPAPAAAAAPPPQAVSEVDVEAILNDLSAKSGQTLNWRTSIVDLMKLLGLDSSLAERKGLAQEFGYTGALDGSAEMNIWLHRQVMRELAANGGKVPAELLS
jgi:hypothetical protein